MHEAALVRGLMRILENARDREGFRAIRAVRVEVGALSCVTPEALRFAFDAAKAGTIADEATLELETVPMRVTCDRCGQVAVLPGRGNACPACGSLDLMIDTGQELRVRDLVVV